jgi:hypothetical protein
MYVAEEIALLYLFQLGASLTRYYSFICLVGNLYIVATVFEVAVPCLLQDSLAEWARVTGRPIKSALFKLADIFFIRFSCTSAYFFGVSAKLEDG